MSHREVMQQALEALEFANVNHWWGSLTIEKAIISLRTALEQQAEPVAWMDREGDLYKMPEIKNWAPPHTMLYTAPPQRQWVGLTDEDFCDQDHEWIAGASWAEAKLKERNT